MSKSSILIVEDEALVAKVIQLTLEKAGYNIASLATTGEEALSLVEQHRPNLVIMDIVLRGPMDGIEAAKQIRSRWGVPIIYMTSYADAETVNLAKMAEPFGYLVKPVQPKELTATVEMALFKARLEAEKDQLLAELREALAKLKLLCEMLPMCAECMDLYDGQGCWRQIESFIRARSQADSARGVCSICLKALPQNADL